MVVVVLMGTSSPGSSRQTGQLCHLRVPVSGIVARWVQLGISTSPGQTGQRLLLDLLPVTVLALGGQEGTHLLAGEQQ